MSDTTTRDKIFMRMALDQAVIAQHKDEVPVGAIVVYDDQVIGRGYNRSISGISPTAHAEIIALEEAATYLQNYRLVGCELFVSLEPCMMCYGAMIHARIKRCVFATNDLKTGVVSAGLNVAYQHYANHCIEFSSGVYAAESSTLLKNFFAAKRR